MGVVVQAFYLDVKADLGATLDNADWLTFCEAWQTAEGGDAAHNPFNTTLKLPGSTNYRKTPPLVQNYRGQKQGVEATVSTLLEVKYADLITGMRANADPYWLAVLVHESGWGTDLKLFVRVLALNYGFGATR